MNGVWPRHANKHTYFNFTKLHCVYSLLMTIKPIVSNNTLCI